MAWKLSIGRQASAMIEVKKSKKTAPMKSTVWVGIRVDFSIFIGTPMEARRWSSDKVDAMTSGHIVPVRS